MTPPETIFRTCQSCGSAENRRANDTHCYCGVAYDLPAPSPAVTLADVEQVLTDEILGYPLWPQAVLRDAIMAALRAKVGGQ